MMERKEECAASAEAEKKKKKRRFSDEQIRLLESIFESESTTKFEPRKKMQVARELGLQPRQVAIWFQNKRARRKSKQIELDYAKLRANYDCLASGFESLIKEKESLLLELQMLNEQLGKSDVGIEDLKRSDKGRSNKGTTTKFKPEILEEGLNKHKGFITSQNNNNNNSLNNTEQCVANEVGIDDSTASSAKWFNDSGDGLLDPSTSSSSQWLNFSWI